MYFLRILLVASLLYPSLVFAAKDKPERVYPSGHRPCEESLLPQLPLDLALSGREFKGLKINEKVRVLHRIADAVEQMPDGQKLDQDQTRALGVMFKHTLNASNTQLSPLGNELLYLTLKFSGRLPAELGPVFAKIYLNLLERSLELSDWEANPTWRALACGSVIVQILIQIDKRNPLPDLIKADKYLSHGMKREFDLMLHPAFALIMTSIELNLPSATRKDLDLPFADVVNTATGRLRDRLHGAGQEPVQGSFSWLLGQAKQIRALDLEGFPKLAEALNKMETTVFKDVPPKKH
jgi:hypothetical protein